MSIKRKFGPRGWTPERLDSLAGRTYVITGANAGAGFEAARLLLSKGASVVMMNRNADKSAAAIATLKQELGHDADVAFVRMDLDLPPRVEPVNKFGSGVLPGQPLHFVEA